MTEASPKHALEAALKETETLAAASPEDSELLFHHANLLCELGRFEDAKAAYLTLLARTPSHFGALNNFANMLFAAGYTSAARTLYSEAVKQHPGNPKGHVNLAQLLARCNENALALQHLEEALRLDPDHAEAHRGLAYLLTEARQETLAATHRRKAFEKQPVLALPYRGDGVPIRLLQLVSAIGGMIPMRHHLDNRRFQVTVVFVEFYDITLPLPPHDIVFNAIGDADLCGGALKKAMAITAKTQAPVINRPEQVIATTRIGNADRLAAVTHVITAKTLLLPRARLEGDAAGTLRQHGLAFPLLLRAPGFHTGQHFLYAQDGAALRDGVASLPGEELLAMEYLDARGKDGKIRKYRVLFIDGMLYPLHAAISHEWKIHYFTAEMAENPSHRAEDEAFLNAMPQVLGSRAMQALERICTTLGLDYGGIDFSLNAHGEILLFEANATMAVYPPDQDPRWDYRRPAVGRIMEAVQRLLTPHAD